MSDEYLVDFGELDALFDETKDNMYPAPEEYIYWKNYKDRIFYIDYEIEDNYKLVELSKIIVRINWEDRDIPVEERKPIYVYIFSYGGDANQANFFADLLISSKTLVITIAMGAVMSAGFEIFLAGHKRYAFKHTQMLVHSGSASFTGTAEQIAAAQENYKKQLDATKSYVLERTSIDAETFDANRSKDWYFTESDFIKYNIVDAIITDISQIFVKAGDSDGH